MTDRWNGEEQRRGKRRRRERERDRERARRDPEPGAAEAELSPDEQAWRDAHRLAERKVKLTGDLLKLGALVLVLGLFRLWFVVAIVLLCGGWRVLREYYRVAIEPQVRRRFVEHEVERQVHATLTQERRELEGRHSRSLEELSASIAHEIRTPITAAKSLVQQMGEEPTASENVQYARVALEELDRVERSVSHLLRFARDEEMRLGEVRLAEVLDSALETFRDRLARSSIALVRQIEGEGRIAGDADKLRRVVINLVSNAIDALDQGRTLEPRIDVQMGENLAGSEVWLRVRDNGPGLDPSMLGRLWSPFATSKANGTGLGLSICKKLVDAHGGTIEASSEPGGGAEFVVTFPKRALPQEGAR